MCLNKKGIAIAGTLLVDKLNEISSYPQSGELTKIIDIKQSVGGCVPNVAIDLKKILPGLNVQAVGIIGDDPEGDYLLSVLQGENVDTSGVKKCEEYKTSFTEVMSVTGGQRTFFTFTGAADEFGVDDIDFEIINADILHLGYFLLLKKIDQGDGVKILKKAREYGLKTSIDLVSENSDRYSLVLSCLPYVDYLIINEIEAGKLANMQPNDKNLGEISKKLMSLGVKEKVIIHKPEFSVCCSENGVTVLGSYELPKNYIKGTTGAGDAFCAGALAAIYNNKSDLEIMEIASACAVMSLGKADATSGLVELSKAKEFCKNLKRKEIS